MDQTVGDSTFAGSWIGQGSSYRTLAAPSLVDSVAVFVCSNDNPMVVVAMPQASMMVAENVVYFPGTLRNLQLTFQLEFAECFGQVVRSLER